MLCDTRLVTKGYGRSFIASLPPMRRTRSLEDVQAFLRERFGTVEVATP
jgi:ATP-dependent DNA helicase DinG